MLQPLEQDNANAAAAVIDNNNNNNNNSVNPTTTTTNNNNTAIKLTEGLNIDKIVQNSAVTVSPIKKNNNNSNNNLLQSQPLALQQQHRFGRIPRGSSKYSRRVHHSLARMCSQSHRLRSNPQSVARNSNRSKRKEASLLFSIRPTKASRAAMPKMTREPSDRPCNRVSDCAKNFGLCGERARGRCPSSCAPTPTGATGSVVN